MLMEGIKRTAYGIAYGGAVTFIALTVLMIMDYTPPIYVIWQNSLAGMILGIYFGLASLIFEVGTWSPLKKTIIHYSLSIVFYFIVALFLGWIPIALMPILFSIFFFSIIYSIFWFSYQLYYKKVEASLNKSLSNKIIDG